MAIRESIQTSAETLGELLSNGRTYEVPRFQRSYSWGQSEWEDLWEDLIRERGQAGDHYMGAVVLQQRDEGSGFWVIDGQQRLATLSIVVMAFLEQFERWAASGVDQVANRERASLFRERLLSPKDPSSLKLGSRLHLNEFDDPFFQSALINGHQPANLRRLSKSEKALWEAAEYFRERVRTKFAASSDGAALATFIDREFSKRLIFIRIVVDDEQAAYTVFETLNARGVALGTADLLKNFVFAMAATGGSTDLEEMQRLWKRLVDTVPLEQVADLVHHHANSHDTDVSARHVFRWVRGRCRSKAEAFDYVSDLVRAANWYAALLDPNDELWIDHPDVRRWIRALGILNIKQYRPLALAAAPKFASQPKDMERLFRLIVVISIRANIAVRLNSGDIYRGWNRTAVKVTSGKASTVGAIAAAVSGIYPSDEEFKAAFTELRIPARGPRKKLVRYILAGLESEASGRHVDWDSDPFTIEHVLPESPGTDWDYLSEKDKARFTSRLGNYIPLEASLSREVHNCGFSDKVHAYQRSQYSLANEVQAAEWNGESVRNRSLRYAKLASRVWRLDF